MWYCSQANLHCPARQTSARAHSPNLSVYRTCMPDFTTVMRITLFSPRECCCRSMDAENSTKPVEYLQGFAELSEFFGSSPELAHFRRFDVLGARNLLYLQAQLLAIETRLKHYDNEDLRKWKELGKDDEYAMRIEQAARDWISFQNLSARDKHQAEKIQLVFELRKAMKEYRTLMRVRPQRSILTDVEEALVLHSKILSLPSPNNFLVAILKKWFDRNQPFVYHGADLFDRSRDLVSLKSTVDQDALSRGMQATFGYFFKVSFAGAFSIGK